MRFTIPLFIILLLLHLPATAQSTKQTAKTTITELKNGALFVRLRTSENLINALNNAGRAGEAEIRRAEQLEKNRRIASAFAKEFKFCKVYFFYSNHSNDVKNGNYAKHLMNGELQPDTTFSGFYVVGEFDESPNTHLDAFVIKDKNYVPLKKPFPWMFKRNQMLVVALPEDDIAKQVSEAFNDFWLKQNR